MKHKVSVAAILLGLLVWPVLLCGQSPGATTPARIGVINIQDAIAQTQEGKKAFAEVQKKFAPRQQDLARQSQEIQSLQDQLAKQATTLSDEEQRRLARDLEEKQKLFNRAREDAQADFQGESQDVIRRIGQKMVRVISEYAQQNSIALVVDNAQIPVYYWAKEIDIEDEIIKRYDVANPVEGAASTGTGSPSSPAPRPPGSASRPAAAPKPADKPKP